MHNEKLDKHKNVKDTPKGAVPAYLLDREGVSRSKVESTFLLFFFATFFCFFQKKRKEKAGKWSIPILLK